MSVWIVDSRAGYRGWFANLILKKLMTMLTGGFVLSVGPDGFWFEMEGVD